MSGLTLVDALVDKTTIFPSKTEARKMIQGNAVSINKTKIADITAVISLSQCIGDTYLLISKGKKENYLIKLI